MNGTQYINRYFDRFTGNTPGTSNKQNFSVSIDGADEYVASYPSPAEYLQWYMSPTLEEGNHTITLSELDNIDVDYAIVAVGNQTTVQGKDILMDDTSNAIVWTGDWQANTSTLAHVHEGLRRQSPAWELYEGQ